MKLALLEQYVTSTLKMKKYMLIWYLYGKCLNYMANSLSNIFWNIIVPTFVGYFVNAVYVNIYINYESCSADALSWPNHCTGLRAVKFDMEMFCSSGKYVAIYNNKPTVYRIYYQD